MSAAGTAAAAVLCFTQTLGKFWLKCSGDIWCLATVGCCELGYVNQKSEKITIICGPGGGQVGAGDTMDNRHRAKLILGSDKNQGLDKFLQMVQNSPS